MHWAARGSILDVAIVADVFGSITVLTMLGTILISFFGL